LSWMDWMGLWMGCLQLLHEYMVDFQGTSKVGFIKRVVSYGSNHHFESCAPP
jgi:hypothetical protein